VEQEAQLLPRYPRDALYQLKCWLTVVRITQTANNMYADTLSDNTLKSHKCEIYIKFTKF